MRRNAAVALAAAAGTAVGVLLARRRRPLETPAETADERTQELRRKLAEARAATADEEDFEAAGMGAETVAEEPPREKRPAEARVPEPPWEPPARPPAPEPEPAPSERPPVEPDPATQARPPADEFEAMRRRIHEEGRAAAEEMRRENA